ncbi:MAG: thioesterase family protein [Hyphomicrobiaceae bacterium]
MSTERPKVGTRADYRHFLKIPTRWMDNDVYGHVNNVNYYSYFDTLISRYLVVEGRLDYESGPVIGLTVESLCRYYQSFSFPDVIDAGLRVGKLGTSSVRYEIGLFAEGEDAARAEGHFVHVFVDRQSQRPTPIPEPIRGALSCLVPPSR